MDVARLVVIGATITNMKRTSSTTIVTAVAASGVISWIVLTFWRRAGHSLPPVSWMAVIVMLVIALGLLLAGWPVGQVTREARERAADRAAGREPKTNSKRHVDPLRAARTFVLAQAATITGSLLTGWYGATVFVILTGPLVEARLAQLWPAGAAALAALILLFVGVIVEWFCQLPPSDTPEGELAN